MTRVHRQGAHGSSALDRTRAIRKKKPYKVVMEVVTQEKKKLHSVMTYTANAPRGYTFVPLGNRDLTEYCKEKCRKRNLPVHIVSAKPKGKTYGDPDDDAQYGRIDTQRIGHHFPDEVINEACDVLGYYYRHGIFQKITRNYGETQLARSLHSYGERMRLHGRPMNETETKDQIRSAILEVFPKIPEADLTSIVTHAFQEGTNRVGNATDLTLARRVQLAVGAFVRHQYTNYDSILKNGGSWPEARQMAQPLSYAKLREWRDEADSNELEETFREIIVLDEEDDDDSETSEDTSLGTGQREPSLEIISSRATARELQPEDIAIPRTDTQSVSQNPRRMIFLRPLHYAPKPAHVGASNTHLGQQVIRAPARPLLSDLAVPPSRPQERDPYYSVHTRPTDPHLRASAMGPAGRPASTQQYFRDKDGQLYNLQPIEESHETAPVVEYVPSSRSSRQHHDGYMQAPRRVNSLDSQYHDRSAPKPVSRRPSGEDVVLPSVEREPEILTSPTRMDDAFRSRHYDRSSFLPADFPSPKRKAFPEPIYDMRDAHIEQASKRPTPLHYEEMSSPRTAHHSMFHRLHDRPPLEAHSRPRMQPESETIDLTYSPIRHVDRHREFHVAPVRSSASGSCSGLYMPDSQRQYVSHIPEYHTWSERYALPRHEYVEHMEALPRSYVANEGRYTRSGVQYDLLH